MAERLDTVIDRLVEYVQRAGKVSLTDASHVLGLNKNEVEELADLLAKSGLIELQYGLSEIILVAKKPGSHDNSETNLILKKKPGLKPGQEEDSEIVTAAKSLEMDVSKERSSILFIESDAKQRLEKVQQFVSRLEGKKELTNEEADYLAGESELFLKEMKQFETSLENLRMKAIDFQEQILLMKSRIKSLPKIGPKKYVVKETVSSEIKSALGGGLNPQFFLPKLPPMRLPSLPNFSGKPKPVQVQSQPNPPQIQPNPQQGNSKPQPKPEQSNATQSSKTAEAPIIVSKHLVKPSAKKVLKTFKQEPERNAVKKQVKQAKQERPSIAANQVKQVKPLALPVKPVSLLKTKNKKKRLR
ncbi:hypothetical protein HY993_04415 [Candidatus Micrarchaeota archaeon]|nr:hypothetical protein [Candidatus Micrarchaeota archaeon]